MFRGNENEAVYLECLSQWYLFISTLHCIGILLNNPDCSKVKPCVPNTGVSGFESWLTDSLQRFFYGLPENFQANFGIVC
jgi:hypothetical protein